MRIIVLGVALLLLPLVSAAEIHGTIYDQNLDVAQNVLVIVDSTPQQRMLSTDGDYAFTLPIGNYTLTAQYRSGNNNYTSEEFVSIQRDGSYTFDLFLFPGLDTDVIPPVEDVLDEEELPAPEAEQEPVNDVQGTVTRFIIILLLIAFGVLVYKYLPRRAEEAEGDPLLNDVLAFIEKEGGRATQRELRKQFPHSEAKISLVVSELEQRGELQKIKKGRGNILVRKK